MMSTGSKIEWTEATWNPVTGCSPVSKGCVNCYAAAFSHRLECMGQKKYAGLTVLKNGHRQFNGKVGCHEDVLEVPLRWRKPRTIFVCSMSDLYHPEVPFEFVHEVFATAAICRQHMFQVLTKRPERMAEYARCVADSKPHDDVNQAVFDPVNAVYGGFATWPLPNVWLGATVENAEQLPRVAELLKCPAVVRFLSLEPLLGPIDLSPWFGDGQCVKCQWRGFHRDDFEEFPNQRCYRSLYDDEEDREEGLVCPSCGEQAITTMNPSEFTPDIHWIIIGGESGPGARPCAIEDIRSIIRQARAAGVPVFVKQLGANPTLNGKRLKLQSRNGKDMAEWPDDLRVRELPTQAN